MKTIITTPVCPDAIAALRVGDVFYLSGILATGRDEVHRRVVHEKTPCPFDFKGQAVFHAGPIVREGGRWELISIGPTTSMRVEEWAADFIAQTGVKIMIGKGGMGPRTAAACREHAAIHCVYPGGCAVLGAGQIESIKGVFWRELGMPECIWVMEARELGPLIVTIDTKGGNMYAESAAVYNERKAGCVEAITSQFP